MKRIITIFFFMVSTLTAHAKFTADAIYSGDDRKEIVDVTDPAVLRSADATVAMFMTKNLKPEADSFLIDTTPMSTAMKICPEERFSHQPSAAECTGVLIARNRILTAGHCISKKTCSQSVFAFGYALNPKGGWPTRLAKDSVYVCKKILSRSNTETFDYAIVEIDRAVTDHVPSRLASAEVEADDEIYLLSHPAGTPLKYSPPQKVIRADEKTFTAEIDALGGSSGGPVFSARTHEIVGILVAGGDDYFKDSKRKCRRLIQCKSGECLGEISTQASAIVEANPQ